MNISDLPHMPHSNDLGWITEEQPFDTNVHSNDLQQRFTRFLVDNQLAAAQEDRDLAQGIHNSLSCNYSTGVCNRKQSQPAASGNSSAQPAHSEMPHTSILVETLSGTVITLLLDMNPADVDCTLTIGDLKRMIEESHGYLASKQRLIFAGKMLRDDQRTNDMDLGLQKESKLYLCLPVGEEFSQRSQQQPTDERFKIKLDITDYRCGQWQTIEVKSSDTIRTIAEQHPYFGSDGVAFNRDRAYFVLVERNDAAGQRIRPEYKQKETSLYDKDMPISHCLTPGCFLRMRVRGVF